MRKKTTTFIPVLLLAALSLSACSGTTSTPATSTKAANSASATQQASQTPTPTATSDSAAPTPAQTPSNVPNTGLYLLITGEPGEAKVSIVHYTGGTSAADHKDGKNYTEQALTVKVPSYVPVKLEGLSQITENSTKAGQSLGCDFMYNGEFRVKTAPRAVDPDVTSFCTQ